MRKESNYYSAKDNYIIDFCQSFVIFDVRQNFGEPHHWYVSNPKVELGYYFIK